MTNPTHEIATAMIEGGWHVVPIKPNTKRPIGKDWQNKVYEVEDFPAKCGVGIMTGHGVIAIDIDSYDPEISKAVADEAKRRFGEDTIERIGQFPKTALFFRAPAGLKKRTVKLAPSEHVPAGKEEAVEVLAKGQQCVAYGVHPDTGQPYKWVGLEPWDGFIGGVDFLAEIKEPDLKDFLNWVQTNYGNERPKLSEQAMQHFPTISAGLCEVEEAKELLSYIPADCGYDDWLRVLMACHSHFEGAQEGFALVDEWSAQGAKYVAGEVAQKWNSFSGQGVNWETVPALARQHGADLSAIARKHKTERSGNGGEIWKNMKASSKRAEKLAKRIDEQIAKVLKGVPAINAERVGAMLNSVVWSGAKSKFMFLNRDGGFIIFLKGDGWPHMCKRFGNPLDLAGLENALQVAFPSPCKDKDDARKDVKSILRRSIESELMHANQRERIEWRVDPFINESYVELGDLTARFILTHKPFQSGKINDALVEDFRDHFPEFDRLLYWIAACRFADDRKKSFLWMYASSDFGKGLIFSLLKELGAVVEMSVKEIEAAFEGKPLAKGPEDFRRAWILWIDEFKSVKSELKQVQSEMSVSPKFGLQSSVELFAKVFTSAESVSSLAGDHGVEAQFANRMSLFECSGTVVDRPLFRGNPDYATSLRNYMAKTLNKYCEAFVAKGRRDAAMEARNELNAFADEYGIAKRFGNLDDHLTNIAEEFRNWLEASFHCPSVVIRQSDGAMLLKTPSKVLSDYLDERFDYSERFTIQRRKQDILKHLSVSGLGVEQHKINGINTKAVIFG